MLGSTYQFQVIDDHLQFQSFYMCSPQNLYPWMKASAAKDRTPINIWTPKYTRSAINVNVHNFYINADIRDFIFPISIFKESENEH